MPRTTTATLWYAGPPTLELRALVSMLEAEGVEVEWEPPLERRGYVGEVEAGVTIAIIVTGVPAAIRAGLAEWRERFGKGATATDDGDLDDFPAP